MIWKYGLLGALCLLVGRWAMALEHDDVLSELAKLAIIPGAYLLLVVLAHHRPALLLLPISMGLFLPLMFCAAKTLLLPPAPRGVAKKELYRV